MDIQLHNIWNNGTVPLLTWQMVDCDGSRHPGVVKLVNNRTFDLYINTFADRLKQWLAGNDGVYGNDDDRRIFLRLGRCFRERKRSEHIDGSLLAHEMNGNWYPWSLDSTPDEYVQAWHHIHDIFTNKSIDSTRLQWIWSVNYQDGSYKAEDYWVGDNYTDWLGIDGYNLGASQGWSHWSSPDQVFDDMLGRLRKLSSTKPLSINEYGTSSIIMLNISSVIMKTEWLNQFYNYIDTQQIKMATYFNIDEETDWAIFGGIRGDETWNNFSVYTTYKNNLQSYEWIEPNATNPRLITDEQFAGRF